VIYLLRLEKSLIPFLQLTGNLSSTGPLPATFFLITTSTTGSIFPLLRMQTDWAAGRTDFEAVARTIVNFKVVRVILRVDRYVLKLLVNFVRFGLSLIRSDQKSGATQTLRDKLNPRVHSEVTRNISG
jgi:hypothetical protein